MFSFYPHAGHEGRGLNLPGKISPGGMIALGIWSLWGLAASVVLLRRFSGAFTVSLPTPVFAWLMMGGLFSLVFASLLLSQSSASEVSPFRTQQTSLNVVIAFLMILGLQPAKGIWPYLISLAVLFIAGAVGWYAGSFFHRMKKISIRELSRWLELPAAPRMNSGIPATPLEPSIPALSELPAGMTSRLIQRSETGGKSVEGLLEVHFAAGQKQTVVHIPFCPPLKSTIGLTCDCIGDNFDVQVSALFPYGMRLDARRTHAETESSGTLRFTVMQDLTVQ